MPQMWCNMTIPPHNYDFFRDLFCESACLSFGLCEPIHLSAFLYVCLPVGLSSCLSVCLSICLPVHMSACPYVCLFACMSVWSTSIAKSEGATPRRRQTDDVAAVRIRLSSQQQVDFLTADRGGGRACVDPHPAPPLSSLLPSSPPLFSPLLSSHQHHCLLLFLNYWGDSARRIHSSVINSFFFGLFPAWTIAPFIVFTLGN